MEKKMFFFPCTFCYAKLVSDVAEIGKKRICTQCHKQTIVPPLPKRIPPLAEVVRTAKQNIATVCPYCVNVQKISFKYVGRKIYCSQCQMIIEVPKLQAKKLALELSQKSVVADGKNVVILNAKVTDKNNFPVAEESLFFVIRREFGKPIHVSEKSNKDGLVSIGYTASVYSGTTKIEVIFAKNKNIFIKTSLIETKGIADGGVIYESIDIFSCEKNDEYVKGKIVLKNPGRENIIATKVTIVDSYHPENILWKNSEDFEISAKEIYHLPLQILRKSLEDLIESNILKVETYFSAKDKPKKIALKNIQHTLNIKPKLWFDIVIPNKIKAGIPFRLSLAAMREDAIDVELNEELTLSFHYETISAPDGSLASFAKEEKITFFKGVGHTSANFCSFACQKNALIQVSLDKEIRGTFKNIEIFPKSEVYFQIELSSPQINGEGFSGKNTIEICDEYSNLMVDFSDPVIIAVSSGFLKKGAKKIVTSVQALNGKINLSAENFRIELSTELPASCDFICQYKDQITSTPLLVHPKASVISIIETNFSSERIEEGSNFHLNISLDKNGDTFFEVLNVKVQWKVDNSLLQEQLCTFTFLDNILQIIIPPIKNNHNGNVSLELTIETKDTFTKKTNSLLTELTGLYIEKKERFFQGIVKESVIAGNDFAVEICVLENKKIDTFYNGTKEISFFSESEQVNEKLILDFKNGVSITPKLFVFKNQGSASLHIEDKSIISSGEVNFNVMFAPLHKLSIHMDVQKSHSYLQGNNYILALDNFGNRIHNFNQDLSVHTENIQLYKSDFFNVIPGEMFIDGKFVFDDTWNIRVIDNEAEKIISFSCDEIIASSELHVLPKKGVIVCEKFLCNTKYVELGQDISATITLFNSAGKKQELKTVNLNFLNVSTQQYYSSEVTLNRTINSFEHQKENLTIKMPNDFSLGEVKIYITLHVENTEKEKFAYSFAKFINMQIEPADRELKCLLPDNIVAGENFSLGLCILRNKEKDTTFNRTVTIDFEKPLHFGSFAPNIPRKLKVRFINGEAITPEKFNFSLPGKLYNIIANINDAGGAKGVFVLNNCFATDLDSFGLTCDQKQISHQAFIGNFSISALDKFGNIITSFNKDIIIASNGALQRNGKIFTIIKNEFVSGICSIKGSELSYKLNSEMEENVSISLSHNNIISKHKIKITPEPAKLELVNIKIPQKKVEWNEDNYLLVFNIRNIGKTSANVLSSSITFFHNGKIAKGYSIQPQKKLPKVAPGKSETFSLLIGLNKTVPVGLHTIEIVINYEDSYYNVSKSSKQETKAWQVEPCGRKITGVASKKINVGRSFSLNLAVLIDGKIDENYNGHHKYLCGCKNNIDKKIPRNLELNFTKGKAVSGKVFTFFEKGKNLEIELYETEIGGASGEFSINVRSELLIDKLRRYFAICQQKFKQYQRSIVLTLICLISIIMLNAHWNAVKETQKLKIIVISGDVFADGQRLKANDVVYQDQNIELQKGSFCVLKTSNGAIIKLHKSARIKLKSLGRGLFSSANASSIKVNGGSFSYSTNKKKDDFPEIEIPDADKLDVSSKDFNIGIKEAGSFVSVFEGDLALTSGGKTQSVKKNYGSSVKKGQVPSKPQKLPPAPRWIFPKMGEVVTTNAVPVGWHSVKSVSSYTIDVYSIEKLDSEVEGSFSLSDYISSDKKNNILHKIRGLKNGNFQCKITGTQEDGFASLPSKFRTFVHDAEDDKYELHINAENAQSRRLINIPNYIVAFPENQKSNFPNAKLLETGKYILPNNTEFKAGKYNVTISILGYQSETLEITIGTEEAIVTPPAIKLIAKKRKIAWILRPDVFDAKACKNLKIQQNGTKLENFPEYLKPGVYNFSVVASGFQLYQNNFSVLPGFEIQTLVILLQAKKRQIKYDIVTEIGKFNGIVTIGNLKNPKFIFPGIYRVNIECEGFISQNKPLIILPNDEFFELKEKLDVKNRNLHLTVKGATNIPVVFSKDKTYFSLINDTIKDIRPGKWKITIEDPHHEIAPNEVDIPAGEKLFDFSVIVKPKSVPLQLTIDIPQELPVHLTLRDVNDQERELPRGEVVMLQPGEYVINIQADGYRKKVLNVLISSGQEAFFNITLKPLLVPIASYVIDDEKNLRADIRGFKYQGSFQENLSLLPGNYQIEIETALYGTLSADVQISLGQEIYEIHMSLPHEERELSFDLNQILSYDVEIASPKNFRIDGALYPFLVKEDGRLLLPEKINIYSNWKYVVLSIFKKTETLHFQVGYYHANFKMSSYGEVISLGFSQINVDKFIKHLNNISDLSVQTKRIKLTITREFILNMSVKSKKTLSQFIEKLLEKSSEKLQYLIEMLKE